jgi:hypothetical protein
MRGFASWVGLLSLIGCGDSTTPPPSRNDGGLGDSGLDYTPVDVDTFAPESVQAGMPFTISCLLLDEAGEMLMPPAGLSPAIRTVPESSIDEIGGTFIATRAGTIEVACAFPTLGLADQTPSLVEVLPGAPARVEARLDRDAITAGESVTVTCVAVDAYGNPIVEVPATPRADPAADGNTFTDLTGTFESAGTFDVHCDVEGAESRPARLQVSPALPAALVIALVPELPVYTVGQVIELARVVTDRYGNRIDDALVPVTSAPDGMRVGDGRYRYLTDGRYRLTATVTPPTEGGVGLTDSREFTVDSRGPAIECDSPVHGAIVNTTPGSSLAFSGSVDDLSSISTVSVNGTSVPVDGSGNFSTTLTTRFGINFVDIEATDASGQITTRTCAFLLADTWAPDTAAFGDALALRLGASAIDDGARGGALNSLGDILQTVLNSPGLRTTLHESLLASNPLKPRSCDQRIFGACVFTSEINYLDSELRGPNTATLSLVDGGIRANVGLRDTRAQLRISGTLDSTGWVTFSSIDVGVIFDTSLSGGRLRMSVRPGSVTTSVGSISTSFSGLAGIIIDIVASLVNGTLRSLVRDLVTNWVTDNFNSILDGVVGGLDVSTLGTSFEVPRLDGTGNISVAFAPDFTSLSTNSSRMLVGLGTRLSTTPAHARPTLGAPIPSGPARYDASTTSATQLGLHVGVLSQALHALWRAGFLDATLDAGSVSGLPGGVRAELTTLLPPSVEMIEGDRVQLSLGAINLRLAYPSFFATPIDAALGARASMRVRLSGDEFVFDDFRIDELYFSTDSVSLDERARTAIEGVLTRILGRVVGSALTDALPAVPVPAFELPASLAGYGLPAGASLGLTSPSLSTAPRHLVLEGGFGIR